jgi:hypothetical protein
MIRIATVAAVIAATLSLTACEANPGTTASTSPLRIQHGNAEPWCVAAEQARCSHHEQLPHWSDGVVSIVLIAARRSTFSGRGLRPLALAALTAAPATPLRWLDRTSSGRL